MDNGKTVILTGHTGFLGKSILKKFPDAIGFSRSNFVNLLKEIQSKNLNCDLIIHGAGRVGGIGYNIDHPAQMIRDNLLMGLNVLDFAVRSEAKRFINVSSACIYGNSLEYPKPSDLFTCRPNETHLPYAIAKGAIVEAVNAYNIQYSLNGINLILSNLYGPGCDFDEYRSHFIPAAIVKIARAERENAEKVTFKGRGDVIRDFLFVEDAAESIVRASECDLKGSYNVGSGFPHTIEEIANTIAELVNYKGIIEFDKNFESGQLNRSIELKESGLPGFKASQLLGEGLEKTIKDYKTRQSGILVKA